MVYILMGVSGSGKTTIGRLLAEKLALAFHDADDFHSRENIGKMKRSVPLTDEDRMPWLFDLAIHVAQWNTRGGAVLACSALKEPYRKILNWNGKEDVTYIYLKGDRDLLMGRMSSRTTHFFPAELLDSQLESLEEPRDAVTVSANGSPDRIRELISDELVARGLLPAVSRSVH